MTRLLTALAAALILFAAPARAQMDYPATYGQDRAEIEDLMARYLFAIDYSDWDAYVATFTEDGELEFASGLFKGRDVIRDTVMRFAERIGSFYHTEDGQPAILRHVILQSSIRVEGDRAWGRSLWLEMANNGPADTVKMGTYGIYEDEFARIDGRWLIAKRRVLNEFLPDRRSGPGNPVREMDVAAEAFRGGE